MQTVKNGNPRVNSFQIRSSSSAAAKSPFRHREGPMSPTIVRRPGGPPEAARRNRSRLARPKCRPNKLADLVEEVAVIAMELNGVPAACDSRERGQRWHEQPPREGVIDRADQIQVDARLQHVAVRAAVDCRGDEFVIPVHRQEDDPGFQSISPELLERLKAVELGHRDVQHDHIGPEAHGQVQRLATVARKGHDVKSGSKKAADRFQKRDVIVGQEDPRFGWRFDVHYCRSPR
jgi:hypothetical protein